MPAINARDGKLLYHLTALDNLPSIIENGLLPRSVLLNNNVPFCDVANSAIIFERQDLDKYTPFHFHPRTPFDYAVKLNNPNISFVYLCLQRDIAKDNDFLILPQHPLSTLKPQLYNYEEGFSLIDWDAMAQSSSFSSTAHSTHMAECLTEKPIPVNCIQQIGVKDEQTKYIVEEMLQDVDGTLPYINIQPWF
jgi:hypothetical protein